jgi:hypothetical protein
MSWGCTAAARKIENAPVSWDDACVDGQILMWSDNASLNGSKKMTITGEVFQAQAGIIGFDTTDRLNPATAKQYYNKGYRFCVRYIARDGK